MSKRYPGNFITGNPVALSQTSNNGIWDLKDEFTATNNGTWQEGDGIYEIGKSLRFRSRSAAGVGAYLNRYYLTAGNAKTFTVSLWVKRTTLGIRNGLFTAVESGGGIFWGAEFSANDCLTIYDNIVSGSIALQTTQVFRDTAAWYHIVVSYDTTQAVTSNRARIYINGTQVTQFGTAVYPSQNASTTLYTAGGGYVSIGAWATPYTGSNLGLDGYMAEFNFIDGQGLDSSYFGYFDPITNIWQPKQYTGNYGATGCYIPFNDTSSVGALGWDKSTANSVGTRVSTAQYSTAQSKFGGSSLLLNGSSDYVTVGSPVGDTSLGGIFAMPTTAWTAEFWIYFNSTVEQTILENFTGAGGPGWTIYKTIDGALHMYLNDGATATDFASATGLLTSGQWYHIAYTRNGSTIKGFINGAQVVNSTYAGNELYQSSYPLQIGHRNPGDGRNFYTSAYINDLRITKGVSRYNAAFTAPTSANPLNNTDPYWTNVVLAMPFNGPAGSYNFPNYSLYANNYALNNISLTAGVNYDSMVDSPTNVITTATDVGGVVPGNYCTWTPLVGGGLRAGSVGYSSNIVTLSDGNLSGSFSLNSGYAPMEYSMGTIPLPNAGKWYWEFTNLSNATCGVFKGQTLPLSGSGGGQEAFVGYSAGGSWVLGTNAAGTTTGTALSASSSDTIGVAVDMDGKNIYFYKNNTYMGGITGFSDTNTGSNPASAGSWTTDCNMWIPIRGNDTSGAGGTSTVNFGQRPFTYAPPSGYKSLNTTNIQMLGTVAIGNAALTPNKYFDISVYTGIGNTQQVKNSGKFQPDLVWVKARSVSNYDHILVDSVRGPGNILSTDLTSAESSGLGYWVTSLDSDGFTLGHAGANGTNASGVSYVGWQWKQSPQSGLNIVTYTGNGTLRTISHNLGVVPSMIWIKGRDTNASGGPGKWGANDWMVQHVGMGWGYQMAWNSIATSEAEGQLAAPTASVFTVPSYGQVNYTGNRFVAYVWAEVPGFSKFGTYMANNLTDGDFIYTGFRPKYVMVKLINGSNSWEVWDSTRSPVFNGNLVTGGAGTNLALFLDDTEPESQRDGAQFFSNGFKLNATGSRSNYPAGNTYIYMAFAESPFYLNNRAK